MNSTEEAPESNEVNTYGAHLLVDFSPIREADELMDECKSFLQQASATMFTIPLVSRITGGVRNWRSKRRDVKLLALFQPLYPRVTDVEARLRNIIGEVVEKKTALRLQARHLQVRLESCIQHNKQQLSLTEAPLEELRSMINKISGESSRIKQMIEFNKELLRINKVEKVSKGQSFVRWGGAGNLSKSSRNAMTNKRYLTEEELLRDDLHPDIETRLIVLRKLREKFVGGLAVMLEMRGSQMANLDNCEQSLQIINSIVDRGSIIAERLNLDANIPSPSSSSGSSASSAAVAASAAAAALTCFDHARCSDCSYGYSMTCDCASHLAALQHQAMDANERLHLLVEMREQICEEAERICADHGDVVTGVKAVDESVAAAAAERSGTTAAVIAAFDKEGTSTNDVAGASENYGGGSGNGSEASVSSSSSGSVNTSSNSTAMNGRSNSNSVRFDSKDSKGGETASNSSLNMSAAVAASLTRDEDTSKALKQLNTAIRELRGSRKVHIPASTAELFASLGAADLSDEDDDDSLA